MNSATLNIKVSPRRKLTTREAADYCGLSSKRFPYEGQVRPRAMPKGGFLYDMQDLDQWIDSLKSGKSILDDEIIEKLG